MEPRTSGDSRLNIRGFLAPPVCPNSSSACLIPPKWLAGSKLRQRHLWRNRIKGWFSYPRTSRDGKPKADQRTIPGLTNLTSYLVLGLTFPIWYGFKDQWKANWLAKQPARYANLDLDNSQDLQLAGYPRRHPGARRRYLRRLALRQGVCLSQRGRILLCRQGVPRFVEGVAAQRQSNSTISHLNLTSCPDVSTLPHQKNTQASFIV